jgi:hypothetical protein
LAGSREVRGDERARPDAFGHEGGRLRHGEKEARHEGEIDVLTGEA